MFCAPVRSKACPATPCRRRPWGLTVWLCLTFLAAWLPRSAGAQQQVGFILDISDGKWSINQSPSIKLKKGQSLPAEGRIRVQSPSDDDFITITDLKGEVIINRRCRERGQCDGEIRLPASPERPGALSASWDAVMNLIRGEPDRYSVHRVREGELADALVELKGEQIDLRDVFRKYEKGTYHFRVRSLARDSTPAGRIRTGPLAFDWTPSQPSAVTVSGLQPGLYELTLLEREGNAFSPTAITAWILVEPPATFRQSAEAFSAAKQVADKWAGTVNPEVSRGFLRARLDELAMRAKH